MRFVAVGVSALAFLLGFAGCETEKPGFIDNPPPEQASYSSTPPAAQLRPAPAAPASANAPAITNALASTNAPTTEGMVLREGDTIRISFPGAPSLDTLQKIQPDGKIGLKLIGEVQAAGLTPSALEKELIRSYGSQLQTKEISVTVESSAYPVYLTGAVLRPGKILLDRPATALEAIMEAGGFDYAKAKLKKVTVIRHENGRTEHFILDMRGILQAKKTEQFNLKPSDIIYVPERFNWF